MKIQELRKSKKARLWIIGGLIVVAGVIFYFVKGTALKVAVGAMIGLLLVAFGLEASNNDYDVKKLAQTGSFAAAKLERDEKGNITNIGAFCDAKELNYNCSDFKNQPEAQQVYDECKNGHGRNMDVYGLDGDKDGKVCESLPKNK